MSNKNNMMLTRGLAALLLLIVVVGDDSPCGRSVIQSAHAQNATGTPINFGSIGDYRTTTQLGALLNAAAFGLNLSFGINNNLRNGVKGRPVHLNIRYNNDDSETAPGLMADLMANVSDLVGIAHVLGDKTILKTVEFIDALPDSQKMVLFQPSGGVNRWFQYSQTYLNAIPPITAEQYAGIRYFIYNHQFTRFAVVTDVVNPVQGVELVPELQRLLTEVGARLVFYFKLNRTSSLTGFDISQMSELISTKPHVLVVHTSLYPNTAALIVSVLVSVPSAYILTNAGLMPLLELALKALPSKSVIQDRVHSTNVGPLYSDTTIDAVKRFRNELSAVAATSTSPNMLNLTYLDAYPPVGIFVFFGWALGEQLVEALRRLDIVSSTALRASVFKSSIYTIDDIVLGPYSGECTGSRTLYCRCNNGARVVSMVQYTSQLTCIPTPTGTLTLPLSSCAAVNLSLPSPLVAVAIVPYQVGGTDSIVLEYVIGRQAAYTDQDVDGVLIQQVYSGNSTAALQNLNTEKLLTASAGSVLNTPIGDATGIGAVIDPMEVRPRLYGGFRRDVVYVSPTYEQELHALASLAVAQGKGITVLSALEDGSAVGSTLTRSMNTLGKEGGGHRSSASIASGLLATGDGGVTILHGISTSADIAAIATHLGQQTNAIVAIPMAHLLVWYRELVAAVTDESQRSRIVFATSLPNWAGPVSGETTGPALQTYFDRVPATNRTPGSLRGFMTHQLLTYVSSRMPKVKSSTEFLRMLYGASVVVMDTALVVGPYFDATCTSGGDTTCEMNVGARLIRVRSLSASITLANGSASGADSSSITLDSGRISYTGLPTTDNSLMNIIIIVAVVGGLLVVSGVVALVLVCLCSGRSNWTAPKDESDAFTIIFTDIQSSTNLWAEAPEAMAPALDHHHALIRKLCKKHKGYEVKTIGDAFMVAFRDAVDAVNLSSALQFDFYNDKTWSQQIDHAYLEMDHVSTENKKPEERTMYSIALSQEDYGKVWNGLRVRIGIHTGFGEIKKDPVSHGYDYYGTVVNTAARTESIAHGGQVIMTEAAFAASGISEDRVVPMGPVVLRGVPDPIQMFELTTIPNRIFPPLRVEKAQEEEDMSGNGGLLDEVGSLSSARRHHIMSPTMQHHKTHAYTLLKIVLSVFPKNARDKTLNDICNRWRIAPQKQPHQRDSSSRRTKNATSAASSSSTTTTSAACNKEVDYRLDALSTKLAPIMAKSSTTNNNNNNNTKNNLDRSDSASTRSNISNQIINIQHLHDRSINFGGMSGGVEASSGGGDLSDGESKEYQN